MTSYVASTFAGGRGYQSGRIMRLSEDFAIAKHVVLPPACSTIDYFVSAGNYGPRQYMVGGHTANLVVDEEFRCNRQGIIPPNTPPSIAAGAGTTLQIAYLSFYDEVTKERSSLSEGTPITGSTTRTWSNLPGPADVPGDTVILEGLVTIVGTAVTGDGATAKTNFTDLRPGDRVAVVGGPARWAQVRSITSPSAMTLDDAGLAGGPGLSLVARPFSRVSHVELWVSVDGALPRFIMRVRIGTTTVVESTATLALGEAFITTFEPMPNGRISVFYGDRQFISGVEGHLDTVYLSDIGFPERWSGLAFVTPYNEPIVGMFRYRDYVVLLCPDSSYKLQGYTEDDYVRSVLEPDIGGCGHHGNRIAEGRAMVPGRKGMQIFNGAFHDGIPQRRSEWSADYITSPAAFEMGIAAVNPNDQTYRFVPYYLRLNATVQTQAAIDRCMIYVGHYADVGPQAGGALSTPEWTSDAHLSTDQTWSVQPITYVAYLVPSGTKIGKFYHGDAIGRIYEEDETGTVPYIGTSVAAPAHYLMQDPGGDPREGKNLARMWSYVISEDSDWTLQVWAGDERCYWPLSTWPTGTPNTIQPGWKDDVVASKLEQTGYTYKGVASTVRWQPKSVHVHKPGDRSAGRGFTFAYVFHDPIDAQLIGFGGVIEPGEAGRPPILALTE